MRKIAAAAFVVTALIPAAGIPQHVCESTGQVVCPEGQTWNAETSKCEAPVSS
jgi:hypothetical protein